MSDTSDYGNESNPHGDYDFVVASMPASTDNPIPAQFDYRPIPIDNRTAQGGNESLSFTGRSNIYNSYAGVDIVAQIVIPNEEPITLGELQTFSYSIHRENAPVRLLGHVSPVGFLKGARTIGGSMIFTVFNFYAFYRLRQFQVAISHRLYPVADMLPPIDMVFTFANESGVFSKMKLHGVTFIDEGGTMSIDDLITEQTYCVDPLTEALTRDGWKDYSSLMEDDELLSLNPDTKAIEWVPVEGVHIFDYDGPMVQWQNSRGVDALTTPNHKWVSTSQYQLAQHGFAGAKFRFSETSSISAERLLVTSGGIPLCFANEPVFSTELVELIGWTVTEGTLNRDGQGNVYGVQIGQSEQANPDQVDKLSRLVKHFQSQGVSASISNMNTDGHRVFYFGKGIGSIVGNIVTDNKTLTSEFLSLLTYEQALYLYETLIDGDGHRSVSSTEYFIQNKGHRVDAFQMLMSMLGRRTSVKSKSDSEFGTITTVYNSDVIAHFDKQEVKYNGIVWCPQTRYGTWLARRNGNTFWTGNSYMARGIQPMTGFYIPQDI